MAPVTENEVEISSPEMDEKTRVSMERCAEFLARMIHKYGAEIIREIDAEKKNFTL